MGWSGRGSSNSNNRGSAADRRARKVWLLLMFNPELGPDKAMCAYECGTILTLETVTVDRFPLRGADGGSYRRGNIRPACGDCNNADGIHDGSARAHAAKAAKRVVRSSHGDR